MSFETRRLRVRIALNQGSFEGTDKKDIVELEGHRISAAIKNDGWALAMGSATIRIWGVRQDIMNQLYMLQAPVKGEHVIRASKIRLEAAEGSDDYQTVFEGQVYHCYPDYNAAPNVYMHIEATSCAFTMWDVPPPNSGKGAHKVAELIEGLAKSIGFAFKNNGVETTVTDYYVSGSAINQIRELARTSQTMCNIENDVVTIWENGKNNGAPVIDLSPATGLVGYPKLELNGVNITHLFNRNIDLGREVELLTDIPQLCGRWFVHVMHHSLDSEVPNGKWFTQAFMTRSAYALAKN